MRNGDEAETELAGEELVSLPSPPFHATRGMSPGPRGCWAMKKDSTPCGATVMREAEYCAAHSGKGIAADPAHYAPLGHEGRSRKAAMRAELRLVYGNTRNGGVRAALKVAAEREAIALAGSAINAAISPDVDTLKRGQHALAVIEAVDPARTSQVSVSGTLDPQAVDNLSLAELVALAGNMGLTSDGAPSGVLEAQSVRSPS